MSHFEFQLFPWYQKFCLILIFDELAFLLFINKCFLKHRNLLIANYGVLKSIANISGLTALAQYRSGALFLEGCDL